MTLAVGSTDVNIEEVGLKAQRVKCKIVLYYSDGPQRKGNFPFLHQLPPYSLRSKARRHLRNVRWTGVEIRWH